MAIRFISVKKCVGADNDNDCVKDIGFKISDRVRAIGENCYYSYFW